MLINDRQRAPGGPPPPAGALPGAAPRGTLAPGFATTTGDDGADPARAAPPLPDRLAAGQPPGPLPPGQGPLRGLPPPARPRTVLRLGDGRWWDEERRLWRDGEGRRVPAPALPEREGLGTTKVVLAAAHLDHDPSRCGPRHRSVKALCQRCHLLHDRPEHRRRIRLTLLRRRALGDLFAGPYPA
jgi:hypothetical protein